MRGTVQLALGLVLYATASVASARFVSTDPVQAQPNTGANFNRYYYANNNPYKFTDPDGREVVYAYGGGVSEANGQKYILSIMFSPTAHGEFRQIESSNQPYTVLIDNTVEPGYNPNSHTVRLNPELGLRIKSTGEVQSPKVNGGHEISHAAEHDRVGDKALAEALTQPSDTAGVSREEARATKVEQAIGKDLGEPTRSNYKDAGEAVRCNQNASTGC